MVSEMNSDFSIMKRPKISVIVPIYKAENYLYRCIDSILAQTYTNFELILIDDGSPDHSGTICDEYAMKDDRIRVFHKPNGGVSSARNLGIDCAKGEWITFVDSDDCLFFSSLNEFVIMCEDDPSSIYIQQAQIIRDGKSDLHPYPFRTKIFKLKNLYATEEQNYIFMFGTPWAKFFNLDIIRRHKICFDEKLSLREDYCFYLSYLCHIDQIKICDYVGYYYDCDSNGDSLTSKTRTPAPDNILYAYHQLQALKKKIISSHNIVEHSVKPWTHYLYKIKVSAITSVFQHKYQMNVRLETLRQFNSREVRESYRPNTSGTRILKMILLVKPDLLRYALLRIAYIFK